MCALAISAKAQDQDTTDVFDRHLHLEGVVVTDLTGDSRLSETPSPVSGISKRSSAIKDVISRSSWRSRSFKDSHNKQKKSW